MRFIYSDCLVNMKMWRYDDYNFNFTHTIEDTQDNIIWLIVDKKSYEEMREYYVKG